MWKSGVQFASEDRKIGAEDLAQLHLSNWISKLFLNAFKLGIKCCKVGSKCSRRNCGISPVLKSKSRKFLLHVSPGLMATYAPGGHLTRDHFSISFWMQTVNWLKKNDLKIDKLYVKDVILGHIKIKAHWTLLNHIIIVDKQTIYNHLS